MKAVVIETCGQALDIVRQVQKQIEKIPFEDRGGWFLVMKPEEYSMILESWRDITGYEGAYQISSWGRVRSLARDVLMPSGMMRHTKEIIMSTRSEVHGHPVVWLSKEGKDKKHFVHRLVAEAFLIPPTSDVVNHKDLDKKNNHLWNLEWATFSENTKHYYDNREKNEPF